MTRKRFVKLLMARGYRRNTANNHAEIARRLGVCYKFYYKWNIIYAPVQGTSSMPYYARNFTIRGNWL